MLEFSPQPISKFSLKILPGFPLASDSSAFKILYLSLLYKNQAPGIGYNPFIFPIIFLALSFHEILPSDFSIFFA